MYFFRMMHSMLFKNVSGQSQKKRIRTFRTSLEHNTEKTYFDARLA